MAVTTVGRTSLAGEEVQFLVLAGGLRWCAAIHLETGGLVTARWDDAAQGLGPMVLVKATASVDQADADPTRPEEMALLRAPVPVGRVGRRKAERLVRPLLHPTSEHLLGFAGPAVPYWTLDGTRPSVAVVAPPSAPVVAAGRCRFPWRNVAHTLPILPSALDALPRRPRRLVVALSAPSQGHCYKVVAALL